jgi:transcriptional regulator with XRE-family HTH domain
MSGEKFAAFMRARREAREIGLREMAKMIGVSPTCISKVERDEFPPPAEDKVRLIAGVIGRDVDELLARAGKVASDLSAEELQRLARPAQKAKDKRAFERWRFLR